MNDKQTSENTKLTSIRLPLNVYSKIETLAAQNQRTISGQIRFMLDEYLRIKES